MTALRVLAVVGAVLLMSTVDGVIGGTIAAFWGDLNGCRYGDVASGTIACVAIWDWAWRLKA